MGPVRSMFDRILHAFSFFLHHLGSEGKVWERQGSDLSRYGSAAMARCGVVSGGGTGDHKRTGVSG